MSGAGEALRRWHLLSLDAPTVAALWCWFLARCAQVMLPWTGAAAMFAAVWMLYAADRLLDARGLASGRATEGLEERHRFHHRHYGRFLAAIAMGSAGLLWLILRMPAEALRLYALLAALLGAWFVVIHGVPERADGRKRRLPKELAVGLFFPAAVFIPTVARRPELRLALLPAAAMLSAVCMLNCLWIYGWEHPEADVRSLEAHGTTRLATAHLRGLTWGVAGVGAAAGLAALLWPSDELRLLRPIALACAGSAGLFLVVDAVRGRMSAVVLRAAVDAALLTPLVWVGGAWLHKG